MGLILFLRPYVANRSFLKTVLCAFRFIGNVARAMSLISSGKFSVLYRMT